MEVRDFDARSCSRIESIICGMFTFLVKIKKIGLVVGFSAE